MPDRRYLRAIVCYLLIPAVLIGGSRLALLIDPELARGHADYVRDYRLLELAQRGAFMAAAGLGLVLWTSACFLVLASRHRSLGWLLLAAAGPFGLMAIAMLEDRSPAPGDRYQQFIRRLKMHWRVPLEVAVFVSAWILAFACMVLKRELMIGFESFRTGTPVAAIVALQNASSGMWAFREGLEVAYLAVLICLAWPILFNIAAARRTPTVR